MRIRTYDIINKGMNGNQREVIHNIVWGFIAGLAFIGFMVLVSSIVQAIR